MNASSEDVGWESPDRAVCWQGSAEVTRITHMLGWDSLSWTWFLTLFLFLNQMAERNQHTANTHACMYGLKAVAEWWVPPSELKLFIYLFLLTHVTLKHENLSAWCFECKRFKETDFGLRRYEMRSRGYELFTFHSKLWSFKNWQSLIFFFFPPL